MNKTLNVPALEIEITNLKKPETNLETGKTPGYVARQSVNVSFALASGKKARIQGWIYLYSTDYNKAEPIKADVDLSCLEGIL